MVRRNLFQRFSVIAASAALALAVGCSKGDDKQAEPAKPAPAPAAKEAPPTVAAKTDPAAIPNPVADAKVLALKFHHDS